MALTEEGMIDVPGLQSRYVRLPSGVKAHYSTIGDSGPSVVLLHGGITGSCGVAGWRFMAPFLAEHGFRVYCPDMPGWGLTEDPNYFYVTGAAGHVDYIHDFTSALCLDRFHILGNSMGADNSILYTLAHPERIISMGLIATRNPGLDLVDEAILDEIVQRLDWHAPGIFGFDGTPDSMREMMAAIIYRPEGISDDLVAMRTGIANRHVEAQARFWDHKKEADVNEGIRLTARGRLEHLTIPTIYLYGQDDVLSPVDFGYVQEDLLPNVQCFYPAECGHQGQTDQPDMFNQVFMEFFRDGQVSRKTADWAGVSKRRPELPNLVASK